MLLLEDSPADAMLAERQLRTALDPVIKRVATESDFRTEVVSGNHELILADYHLPGFSGMKALEIARDLSPEIPFIFLSGSIGEERAIEALQQGAADYILKDHPARLGSAVLAALARKEEVQTRRRAEKALAESEKRFQFAARATRDVIWDWDLPADVLWSSDALESEWGYPSGYAAGTGGKMWSGKIHPDERDAVLASLHAAIDGSGERWSGEYRFQRSDSSYGFVFDRRIILRNPEGVALRVIGAMQDVTGVRYWESQAAEAELLAHLGHFSLDQVTRRREWSPELRRIFGFDETGEITVEMIQARIHPDDRSLVQTMTAATDLPVDFDFRVINAAGETRVLHARVFAESAGGRPARIFGTVQDVTERVESEKRIRELSRINQLILEHAAEGIVAVSTDGAVLFANPSAQRLLGWEPGGAISDLHGMLHPAERDASCPLLAHMRDSTTGIAETEFHTAGGQLLEARYTTAPIVDEGQMIGSVLTFVDITERKRLERKLEQANRISSLGRAAATIAHEFNNVLMGIQPFAEVILRLGEDQKIVKAAVQIAASVTRGKRVTQEILRFTQPAQPSLQPLVIGAWLTELLPELQALTGPRIAIALDIPDTPIAVMGDSEQLQQVFANLVLNARDATPGKGEITIAARMQKRREPFPATHPDGGVALLTVADRGSGMEQAVLEHIFDPLFTTKRTGTGLGLAVAQQVITRHGGSIRAESLPGAGTTFFIELPACHDAAAECAEAPETTGSARVLRRILLVDDETAVATGIAMVLESEGVAVRVVDRGADALPAIQAFRPEAVMIDMTLPDMNGVDLYQRIAREYPSLPVLFSSGHENQDALKDVLRPERIAYLQKPYDMETLLGKLAELMKSETAV